MNMGVSQILHMYITSLINMAFKHNEHGKLKHAKDQSMKACKLNEELEIVTKTNSANL